MKELSHLIEPIVLWAKLFRVVYRALNYGLTLNWPTPIFITWTLLLAPTLMTTTVCAQPVIGQELFFDDLSPVPKTINTDHKELFPLSSTQGDTLWYTRLFKTRGRRNKHSAARIHVWSKADSSSHELQWAGRPPRALVGLSGTAGKVFALQQNSNRGKVKVVTYSQQDHVWGQHSVLYRFRNSSWQKGIYVHPDEKFIVFPMERKDGYGMDDLYVTLRDSTGGWSTPLNLGPTINSKQSEAFPFMIGNRLFFASDGHQGYGGYDIFTAERPYETWKVWTEPTNLGEAINTRNSETNFTVNDDGTVHVVSASAHKSADIYQTKLVGQWPGTSASRRMHETTRTTEDQEFIQKVLRTNNLIFFVKGSYALQPAYKELLYFIASLVKNQPSNKLTLVGHASQEGSKTYNIDLSKKRADEVKDFLVSLGVSSYTIVTVARGEEELLNPNHPAENQRVEIIADLPTVRNR
ncbi:MAG: OmpA family protein [Tunicatimonas sp.]